MTIINYFNRKFPPGGFARNVFDLMTGTAAAQVIYAVISPVLTRLYSPGELGIMALYISIATVGTVVLSWRYELAIVLPKDDRDAANLFALSTALAIGMILLSALVILLFRSPIINLLGSPDIGPWLPVIPLSFLALGLYQVFNSWYTRKKLFKGIAISKIGQSIAAVTVQTITGLSAMGTVGLIAGQVAGAVMATAILARRIIKDDLKYILKSLNKRRMLDAATRYKKYALYSTWPAFIDILTMSLPVFFVTKYFDSNTVGQYALSIRALQIPLFLIGASVGKVYFQRLAQEINEKGDISYLVEKTFLRLLAMAIPGCIFLVVFAPTFFESVFGSPWRTAGEFTQILAPAMAIRFITSPLTTAFGATNRQEVAAVWQVSALISMMFFLFGSLYFNNPIATIIALAINDLILYSIYLLLVFRITGAQILRAFRRGLV